MPQDPRSCVNLPRKMSNERQLYVQFMDGVGQTMAAWSSASSDVIAPGFREVQERAVKLANENADAAFKLAMISFRSSNGSIFFSLSFPVKAGLARQQS